MSNGREKISNEELRQRTKQTPTEQQIKERKWCWIGHTLQKPHCTVERRTLGWKPQCTRKRGRPRTWKKNNTMGTAEGWKKLERDKRTSII